LPNNQDSAGLYNCHGDSEALLRGSEVAKVKTIEVKSFKGIDDITVALEDDTPPGRFIALIGLNESGKTTVLEALSHSVLADPDTSGLMASVQGTPELNDIIPKKSKAAFTGTISIKAHINLDDSDVERVRKFILDKFNFVPTSPIPTTLTVDRQYNFKDSAFMSSMNGWDFNFKVRKRSGSKIYDLSYTSLRSEWTQTVLNIRTFLPQIIYFPTFLVDFPRRIYLEGIHGDVDKYYRRVINDALCSLATPLSIEKHIIARVDKHRKKSAPFSSALRSSPEGQQIDATVQALSMELNRVIFGAWGEIFGKKITGRRIHAEWHVDETSGKHVYLELSIVDNNNVKFYISERSLGFRWFFSFLLFTQFQSFRSEREKAIFLFDEPASHLHARAQQRLLKSFEKIAEPHHLIVYSTHSHYLVNPLWLEKAYIVTNDAYSSEDDDPNEELSSKQTSIRLAKYRSFVSENPTKTTYFQPVLDALDYSIPDLVMSGPSILLEGKFDFYPFMYLMRSSDTDFSLKAYPANGAGTMGALISLHRGWGVPFVVLLDDDEAGRKEKKRYQKDFLLSDCEVATLGELSAGLAGAEFEQVFQEDVRKLWFQKGHTEQPAKQDYYLLFQGLLSQNEEDSLPETQSVFDEILRELSERIAKQQCA
jgi:predicted ATPase